MVKRKKSSSRRSFRPVFDPGSFDVHASEHSIVERIFPVSKSEKVIRLDDAGRGLDVHDAPSHSNARSILIALLSNILVPGLGNVYAKKTAFSVSILILSVLIMFTTFSPVFPLIGLLSVANIPQPGSPEGAMISLFVPANVVLENQSVLVGPTFSILLVPLLLSWIHLLFLFLDSPSHVKWKP